MADINEITLDDISGSNYIDEFLISRLKENGIIKLIDLLNYDESQIAIFKHVGRRKVEKILLFKEDIKANPTKYILYKHNKITIEDKIEDKIEDEIVNVINYLPFDIDVSNTSIYIQIKEVFEQAIVYLETIEKKRLANIIRYYYGIKTPPLTDLEIGKIYNITSERVRTIRTQFVNSLFNGENILNLQLSEEFLFAVNGIKSEVIYKDESVFKRIIEFDGDLVNIQSLLLLFELDIVDATENIGEQFFLCGSNEIGITKNHIKNLYYTLSSQITPINYENLYPLLESNAEKNKIDIIREDIIKILLVEHKWIETINDEFQISYSRLFSETQKVGRIIYENKSISLDNVLAIYNQRIIDESERKSTTTELHTSILKKNDNRFIPQGKTGLWNYSENEESLRPVKDVIAEVVESQEWVATFNDIKNAIQRVGLDYSVGSLRAYICNICTPSIDDSNLFCHKEHTDVYPQINWRSPQMNGRDNWIINTIVSILKDSPDNTLSFNLIKKIAREKVKDVGYNLTHMRTTIKSYEGGDNLFSFDKNDNLTLNLDMLDVIDLDKIGKKNRTPPYYMELASFIINHLRKEETGIALLRDVMNLCEELIPFGNAIPLYQKLVSKFNEIEIIKQGERLYIQLSKDVEFIAEETNVIAIEKIIQNEQVTIDKTLDTSDFVYDSRQKKKVNARLPINWDELIQIMSKELSYYSRWMPLDLTLSEAIVKFKKFMINVDNSNLNSLIPQDIYDYWTCQIDRFDKYHYLGDICTNYEKLLKEIYSNNNDIKINVKGLRETLTYYPELDLGLKVKEKIGFIKILNNLWTSRNIINHGEELVLSNLKMDMAINEYIALYVYTIAKYTN